MKSLITLSICMVFNLTASAKGFKSSVNTYEWFSNTDTSNFEDSAGVSWLLWGNDSLAWEEAIIIRDANIKALTLLGFDTSIVVRDVIMYNGDHVLHTKLSQLDSAHLYVTDWNQSLNTKGMKRNAKKSSMIISNGVKTKLVLKYYPNKGDKENVNAIGLTKKGLILHTLEASLEIIELLWRKTSDQDPVYDMHLRNANRLLKM